MVRQIKQTNRVHRGRATTKESRWMHEPDEVIPCEHKESLTLKDWFGMVGISLFSTAVFILVWWYTA